MTRALAITVGDPAGIGGEIIAKSFQGAPDITAGCFVAGDLAHMRRAAHAAAPPGGPALPVALIDSPAQALEMPPRCIPLLQATAAVPLVPWGRVDAAGGWSAHYPCDARESE